MKEYSAKVEIAHTAYAAYRTDPESAVAKRFQSACRQLGLSGHLVSTFGGSDNNYLVQQGIQGIVVSIAMNNCHSTSGYTSITELERAADLTLVLILSKEQKI